MMTSTEEKFVSLLNEFTCMKESVEKKMDDLDEQFKAQREDYIRRISAKDEEIGVLKGTLDKYRGIASFASLLVYRDDLEEFRQKYLKVHLPESFSTGKIDKTAIIKAYQKFFKTPSGNTSVVEMRNKVIDLISAENISSDDFGKNAASAFIVASRYLHNYRAAVTPHLGVMEVEKMLVEPPPRLSEAELKAMKVLRTVMTKEYRW